MPYNFFSIVIYQKQQIVPLVTLSTEYCWEKDLRPFIADRLFGWIVHDEIIRLLVDHEVGDVYSGVIQFLRIQAVRLTCKPD